MIALAAVLGAQASSIYMNNFSINVGATKTVEVRLNNTTSSGIMALQFDVYIETNSTSYLEFASAPVKAGITNRSDIQIQTNKPDGSNMYRVILYPTSSTLITGSGVIASFQVKCVGNTSNSAAMNMSIKNAIISSSAGTSENLQNTQTVVTVPTPDVVLTADNMTFTDGQTKKVKFSLNTSLNISSLMLDLSGVNLTPDVSTVTLLGTVANTHYKQVNSSLGRVIISSTSNALLPKGTPIFELNVAANNNVQKYGCSLTITNCNASDPSANTYYLPDHSLVPIKQGYDVNGDGEVNVMDVTTLINKILGVISK